MVRNATRASETQFALNIKNPDIQALISESYQEDSEVLTHSVRTLKNRLAVINSFNAYTKTAHPQLVGKEWENTKANPIEARAHEWLNQRVHNSKSRRDDKQQMSVKALMALRWSLLWLIIENSEGVDPTKITKLTFKASDRQHSIFFFPLICLPSQWCKALQRRYSLPSLAMDRILFGVQEIRLLLEAALDHPTCYENGIIAISFTFLQLLSIVLRRGPRKGIFDLEFILDVFKGYAENRIKIVYTLRAPTLFRNVFMYLAGMIAALGIRRGDFRDFNTMQALLDGQGDIIHWKDLVSYTDFPLVTSF
ncbi:hypothetical protein C8R47DRAFT_1219586 [Mycena vitilis]|nr:hypothetical protein C8R47DRAFT_1219586 [Mycena vitilis]